MRALIALLVATAVVFVVYRLYLRKMPTTDAGTAPTQAISLTGVRSDLIRIAQEERSFIALNGHCVSLDELISSGSLSVARTERDGYSYSVQCSGGEFTITARHPAASAGSPIRYPSLAIDSTMQIAEIN
jgi:hypothetical protein